MEPKQKQEARFIPVRRNFDLPIDPNVPDRFQRVFRGQAFKQSRYEKQIKMLNRKSATISTRIQQAQNVGHPTHLLRHRKIAIENRISQLQQYKLEWARNPQAQAPPIAPNQRWMYTDEV